MAISEKDIFESLMKDPNHAYNPIGKVWAEAQQRARQFRNNEKALALAFDEPSALSKLANFLTKAEGEFVDRKDFPEMETWTDQTSEAFFNDYRNLNSRNWDVFVTKWEDYGDFIHQAFGLDLTEALDRTVWENRLEDDELEERLNELEAGSPIPAMAQGASDDASPEEPVSDEVRQGSARVAQDANREYEAMVANIRNSNTEDKAAAIDKLQDKRGLAGLTNFYTSILEMDEDNPARAGIPEVIKLLEERLNIPEEDSIVPKEPVAEPTVEPEAEAPALGDGLLEEPTAEEPAAEEDVPEESAEEPADDRPTFDNTQDALDHYLEASKELPAASREFTDDAGITWKSYEAMNDFLFGEQGLFSDENIGKDYDVYTDADVKAEEGKGLNNWPIPQTELATVISSVSPGGSRVGPKKEKLRTAYLNYFNEHKNDFDSVGEVKEHLQKQLAYKWSRTFKNKLARSKRTEDAIQGDLEAIDEKYNLNHEFLTNEEILGFTEQLTPRRSRREINREVDAPAALDVSVTDTEQRRLLTDNSDILDAIDKHLYERKTDREGRDVADYDRPLLSAEEIPGGLDKLRGFIPAKVLHNAFTPWEMRRTVGTYKELYHLSNVIRDLTAKRQNPENDDLNVPDDAVMKAYSSYNANRLFAAPENRGEAKQLQSDITDAMEDVLTPLNTWGLLPKPDEGNAYLERLDQSPKDAYPWIHGKKSDESTDEARERIGQAQQAALTFDPSNIKLNPAKAPVRGAGRRPVVASPQILPEQQEEDTDASLMGQATDYARDEMRQSKYEDWSDEEKEQENSRLRNEKYAQLVATAAEAPEAPEAPEGEEVADEVVVAPERTGGEAEDWVETLLNEYGENTSLSLDQVTALLSGSLKNKRNGSAFILVKKTLENGETNGNWQGRTAGKEGSPNYEMHTKDGISSTDHPSFEPSTRGANMKPLVDAGLIEPQKKGAISNANYKWTLEGQKLLPLIREMPRVRREMVGGAKGKNGLIPDEFIPILVAIHKNNMFSPEYPDAKLFHDALPTRPTNGDDVETQPVESEEVVNENGDVVEGDGEEPVVPVDENEEPIEQELNNGGDIDPQGESNLDSADVVQQAHDNPDDPVSAEVINALYSHAPSLNGSPQFPTGADGEKFDPSKGDITENYDLLMDMFHDLWDRHNPDSIQRKFGKHTLDGHPYIAPSGRELPGEDNPFMYRIDPTEEDFDTEGYNRARMQAGLLEGWLLTLRSHLAVDNPLDDDGKELYPIEHIYADPKSGSPYTSKYAPNKVRDDFKIQDTHWQWLEALQGLGFVDNNPETGEALPSFASIPHGGHRLSNEAGHGHSFGAGEGFAGLVNAMYGGSGDPDYEGKTIWEELEGKQKADFMKTFGRPPKVDGKTVVGDYGRGAELSSFDKAWKSYQGFLGHSEDKWGPVNIGERIRKADDYPFTQWVTDVLDGKNPENYFDTLPSQLMAAWNFHQKTIDTQAALEKESGAVPTRTPDAVPGPTEGTLPPPTPPKIVDEVVEEAPYWDWKDNPEELSGEYEAVGGEPLEEMPEEPPQEVQLRNKRIKDILVEDYGEDWKNHLQQNHVKDEIRDLLSSAEAGKLEGEWHTRVVQARKKKRDAQAAADVKEEEKKSNESPPLSDADKQRMLKEIQDAYKEQHGTELDSRHQSLLLNWARTNPDQFNKEHANFIKQAGAAKQKEAKSLREHNANNLDGVEGIRSLAGRSDLRTPDLIQQARLIEKWRHENFADMDTKSKAKLEERWMELHQLAANVEDFNIDEELEKGKQFAKDNDLEYGSSEWLNEIGKQHIDEMHSEGRYKENVAKGGDLRANRNYKPWLVVKYDANGNGVLCDLREKDINGDWGKPVEGGKQGLQFDDDQHYFDYKKDPEDLAQHPNAADHFWTNKLDYANLRPHDGRGGVEDVPEFASHKGAFGERGAIGGWYHPESGAWINPHRYNDARGELEGAGEGAGMAVLSGEAYHGSHRADGQGEVNPRYGFARRGGQQQTKLGNDDLSYYIDGQGNIAHAHADWDKVQKRDNNQVQSVNDVIHDWHSQNMYNMAVNYPDSFKDESGNIRAGTVLRPPQAQAPQPLQNADLFKEVKETDALRRRRAAATGPIRENVYGSGLGEDELGGMGQFWSQPQEWKQKFNDVLDIAEDIPFVPLLSFFARRIANIGNFGFTSDSEKVIRRARNAYQIHAATQKRTKKNMDDLSGNAPEMVYTSPGEILARKEDTKQINTHLSKKLRMHQREAQNQALDSTTREQHRRDALTTQAQRDSIMGLNPELPSDWNKIDGLHTNIFGGEQMREGLVPHPSEDVGVYANRLAQPLPQTQQPTVSPSPISGLLEDTPTQQPQPQQAGALVSDEPLPKPKEPVRGLLE